MNNTSKKSLLDNPSLKENPFVMPEGYLSSLEEKVQERIHTPETRLEKIWNISRTSIAMAASFVLLLGVGYGVFSLTPLLDKSGISADNDGFTALVEDGYIDYNFIDYLYDEISLENQLNDGTLVIPDDYSLSIEEGMSEKDLLEYLGIDVPEDK